MAADRLQTRPAVRFLGARAATWRRGRVAADLLVLDARNRLRRGQLGRAGEDLELQLRGVARLELVVRRHVDRLLESSDGPGRHGVAQRRGGRVPAASVGLGVRTWGPTGGE